MAPRRSCQRQSMDRIRVKSILPKPSNSVLNHSLPAMATPDSSTPSGIPDLRKRSVQETRDTNKKQRFKLGMMKSERNTKQAGHRPVTSCTFCRQHKIKCNASDNYPDPCLRCERMGLRCEIDPEFRPKKGSQIQSLKSDVDELKAKIEMLTKNEAMLSLALRQRNLMVNESQLYNTSSPTRDNLIGDSPSLSQGSASAWNYSVNDDQSNGSRESVNLHEQQISSRMTDEIQDKLEADIPEFILGDVTLLLNKANELHQRFVDVNLPYLPIFESKSATELYKKSELLFWAVILTALLSEPEPTLYMSLAQLIKQLAIETCWIRTPRSTHVIQALLIFAIWPLPNEKVLDDSSYRFVGLAKNISLQLGLHRGGEFIKEFLRTQVSLGPNEECWRTRTWLAVFFSEHFWSSVLGLPPSINNTDYLLENARVDPTLPKNYRSLISLSIFQCKLVNVMGISVTRPDGLLEPLNRASSLTILDRELERLKFKLEIEENSDIEVYYYYIKLMICCFAFLPRTPVEDQVKYVSLAYSSATRVVTITSKLINEHILLIELPIYVRNAMTYSAFLLFKLHLSRYLPLKYVDSARQLIVTIHRLFRNTLLSWKDLQNDISRTAKVLENLNIVLYHYPDIFQSPDPSSGIIIRMRSHLTASLFYDLVWCAHEARRRGNSTISDPPARAVEGNGFENDESRPRILPFYNQITKDHFNIISSITSNGTTITTLVPTDQAMNEARLNNGGEDKPLEINGIPLPMLGATGSINDNYKNDTIADQVAMGNSQSVTNTFDNHLILPKENDPLEQTVGEEQFDNMTDHVDSFFQEQSNGWLRNNSSRDDDFLGWFDVNMIS